MYLSKGGSYQLIRIHLSQFCFKGGGGVYFLLCGKLCKQMYVPSWFKLAISVQIHIADIAIGFSYLYIYIFIIVNFNQL